MAGSGTSSRSPARVPAAVSGWCALCSPFGRCRSQSSYPPTIFLHASLAFEDERARDDVVDEGAVVADQQQRARPRRQPLLEELERFDVEIVGRFVQHEDIDRAGQQPRQEQPVPLAA